MGSGDVYKRQIHYWSAVVPAGGIIAIVIVLYALINLLAVKWYGETEFWAALGKVLLIVGLILFTFITMLGGNPLGDRFGFRYWNNPGSFKPLYYEGSLGRWLGFLQCLVQASLPLPDRIMCRWLPARRRIPGLRCPRRIMLCSIA